MPFFWYVDITAGKNAVSENKPKIFEGVLHDGSREDFFADLWWWIGAGIVSEDVFLDYES